MRKIFKRFASLFDNLYIDYYKGFLGHYSIAITLDLYTHVTDDKSKIRKWINYRICIRKSYNQNKNKKRE